MHLVIANTYVAILNLDPYLHGYSKSVAIHDVFLRSSVWLEQMQQVDILISKNQALQILAIF